MIAADPRSAMLSELSGCAYRLGVALGREAEAAEETARKLEYFQLFDRCFFAVRVATALELRLRRAPAGEGPGLGRGEADGAEREPERPERDDASERDRDREQDRDRDREAEPASVPVLLRTLDGIVADAEALSGPAPAALPSLRELLTHVAREPATVAAPKPSGGGLRGRLAGSATAVSLAPQFRSPDGPLGGAGARPAARRATGPPQC